MRHLRLFVMNLLHNLLQNKSRTDQRSTENPQEVYNKSAKNRNNTSRLTDMKNLRILLSTFSRLSNLLAMTTSSGERTLSTTASRKRQRLNALTKNTKSNKKRFTI